MVKGEVNMKKIKGAFPVLITPMDELQEINWNGEIGRASCRERV